MANVSPTGTFPSPLLGQRKASTPAPSSPTLRRARRTSSSLFWTKKQGEFDDVRIRGESFNCGIQFEVSYAPTYPASVAFCGVQKQVAGLATDFEWLQEPFAKVPSGQPKLGFNSKVGDWTKQAVEGGYVRLVLNSTIKVSDLPEGEILWGKCLRYVADKDGNVVQEYMDKKTRIQEVAGSYLNMCSRDPLRESDEKTTVEISYTDNYEDNCRGKWGSDGNIVGTIKCIRTGAEMKVGCYGERWQNLANITVKPFSQEQLDEFNKTCGVGQLVPALGLLLISLLLHFSK